MFFVRQFLIWEIVVDNTRHVTGHRADDSGRIGAVDRLRRRLLAAPGRRYLRRVGGSDRTGGVYRDSAAEGGLGAGARKA